MNFTKKLSVFCLLLSVTGITYGAKSTNKSSTPKVISIDSVANYVNKTVTLESPVVEIEHPKGKILIELEKDFKVVVDTTTNAALIKAGIDVESLPGKTVRITAKLYKDKKYGIQMNLTKASQLVITKNAVLAADSSTTASTSTQSSSSSTSSRRTYSRSTVPEVIIPFKGVISVSEVTSHIGQTGTVEGKVVNTRKSERSNTYFLDFSEKPKVFMVVLFNRMAEAYSSDSSVILGLKGKTIQVTGTITAPGYYGPEILLRDANKEAIKIIGE